MQINLLTGNSTARLRLETFKHSSDYCYLSPQQRKSVRCMNRKKQNVTQKDHCSVEIAKMHEHPLFVLFQNRPLYLKANKSSSVLLQMSHTIAASVLCFCRILYCLHLRCFQSIRHTSLVTGCAPSSQEHLSRVASFLSPTENKSLI